MKIQIQFAILFVIAATCTLFLNGCDFHGDPPAEPELTQTLPVVYKEVQQTEGELISHLTAQKSQNRDHFSFQLANGTDFPWEISATETALLEEAPTVYSQKAALPQMEMIPLYGTLKDGSGEVSLLVSQQWIYGFVNDGHQVYRIEPLELFTHQSGSNYVVYDQALSPDPGPITCATPNPLVPMPDASDMSNFKQANCWKTQIRAHGDYEYFAYKAGGNVNLAAFFVFASIHEADSRFAAINMDLVVTSITILTDPHNPLYYPTSNGYDLSGLLYQTRDFFNFFFATPFPDADLTLLFTGKSGGNVAGRAYLDQVCKNDGQLSYGVIRTGYSGVVMRNIVAHEIGHLFGATHPANVPQSMSCRNQPVYAPRIMSPTVSSSQSAVFAPCARNQMNWHIWFHHDCLSSSSCN